MCSRRLLNIFVNSYKQVDFPTEVIKALLVHPSVSQNWGVSPPPPETKKGIAQESSRGLLSTFSDAAGIVVMFGRNQWTFFRFWGVPQFHGTDARDTQDAKSSPKNRDPARNRYLSTGIPGRGTRPTLISSVPPKKSWLVNLPPPITW